MLSIIITALTVLINLSLGAFVYLRNPKAPPNRYFAFMTASIVGWILTLFFYYIISDPQPLLFIGRLNFAIAAPMTYFFYRFICVFPKETIRPPKAIFYIATSLTIIIVFLSMLTPLIDKQEIAKGVDRIVVYGELWNAWAAVFVANLILGLFMLSIKIKKSKSLIRLQLVYILLGFLLFITIGITTNIILPTLNNFSLQEFGPIATVFFVGFTTYAVIKHRLLNIRIIVARSVAYVTIIMFIASVYTLAIFWISESFFSNKIEFTQSIIFASLTIFAALTFPSLRNFIKRTTDKFLYKNDYNANLLLSELTNIMAKTIELKSLVNDVLTELVNGMHLSKGAIFIFKDNKVYYKQLSEISNQGLYVEESLITLAKPGKIILLQEEEDPKLREIMEKLDISVCLPIADEEINGLILLGEKNSGEIFTEEDIEFLEIFRPTFAIAVENSKSYKEIKGFNVKLQEEVEKATSELRTANTKLLEVDKSKDEFFSLASHELRTPLTSIRGNSSMIQQYFANNLNDPNLKEMIDDIHEGSIRLINIVNDFLETSRLELKKIEFKKDILEMPTLLKLVTGQLTTIAESKKIYLKAKVPENLPKIIADKDRVQQVMFNLVGNAIKFTEKGGVTITVRPEGNFLKVSVVDTGQGISKENQVLLFQKFQQAGSSGYTRDTTKGTGLGLYISKLMIEGMGGVVALEKSEEGKGSTFSFTIPIVTNSSQTSKTKQEIDKSESQLKKNVAKQAK